MDENEIAKIIVNAAFEIHSSLGPGLLESVYEEILYFELLSKGLFVEKQKGIPVSWKEIKMDIGFRADLIVEKRVIVELKSVIAILPVHSKQVLTYLKLSRCKLGLLIDFNEPLIKTGITRIVNNL
ncbi:GxxExxY protein [Mucilaginibacter glaciei]|uniref:GxxExxY protein n=1 Tax=Mucilaginibacter glaciei TaxID=2772109 RepID=A0A926NST0_9SPHI|nr:GxxExxY protein [Mucilaginibacter glaciei]MBD1394668.1 GxxExxY protein [Mucilaginibacter glaciei]